KGLELMGRPDLVAFIPVHQETARKQTPPWRMPWKSLWARLKERAAHRVILSDADQSMSAQLNATDLPTDASFEHHWKAFGQALPRSSGLGDTFAKTLADLRENQGTPRPLGSGVLRCEGDPRPARGRDARCLLRHTWRRRRYWTEWTTPVPDLADIPA